MLSPKDRHRVRELAMQVLFAWDAAAHADNETARQITHDASDDPVVRQLAVEAARGTWDQREMIDQRIERFAPNWPPRRQPGVDRNVLRLAVYELTNLQTPPKVLIDDAVLIARNFSTSASASFINGVLDAIVKEHQALTAGLPVPPAPDASSAPPPATDDHGPGQVPDTE